MRTALRRNFKKTGSWTLVGLSVVSAVIITDLLTIIMSLVSLGRVPIELLVMATVAATAVPSILSPILIHLVKRTARLEDRNKELQNEISERKLAEQEAKYRTENLAAVSELAIECAAAAPETNLVALIAEKIHAATDALAVGISIYDPREQTLTLEYLAVSGTVLSAVSKILGRNVIGLKIPVSPDLLKRMLTEVVAVSGDLAEAAFGAIPQSVAAVIQKVAGTGSFVGLALNHGSELMGTAMVVTHQGQPPLDTDLTLALAHVAAVSLRRKKAEDALRQANWVVENSPVMFFRWKAAEGWPVDLVSENVSQLGYAPQEFLAGSVCYAAIVHPEDLVRITREIHEYVASGVDRFQQEYRIITKDGKVRWVDDRKSAERSADGQVRYYQGIVIDVTERKQAAAEREKLIAEMEAKNTELERFTYTVSHDLKSPLITIRGFLGLLEKDVLAGDHDRLRGDLARIGEATDKMQRLLNDLLELSRIGRIMNPPQTVPFETIVRDAIESAAGQINARDAIVEVAAGLPTVYGDRARLVEVVQNLIDNAVKFMGNQPAPRIEIGARVSEDPSQTVFYVRDNGIGIDPQYHERVFGLFNKLDTTSAGTGVGLALVKRIVEVHGGHVWIESEGVGTGTTFCFTLADKLVKSHG
jgi:PAS domain S-box-containing protein